MSMKYLKNALAVGSAKEAALYFDTVVPFDLIAGATARENSHSIAAQRNPEKILQSLLPNIEDPMGFYRAHSGIAKAFWGLVSLRKFHEEEGSCSSFFKQDSVYLKEIGRIVKLTFSEEIETIAEDIEAGRHDFEQYKRRSNNMLSNGLRSIAFEAYSTWHDPFYSTSLADAAEDQELTPQTVSLVLQGLDMVDADRLSWKKIVAIRQNKLALADLRDLRGFLHKNLTGLEYDVALDKIKSCIHRYQEQVGVLGLETVKKSILMVVSKAGMGFTAMGALASLVVTGQPLEPGALHEVIETAVASGGVLNITGSVGIQFIEAKIAKKKLNASPESSVRYFQRLPKA